MGHFSKSGAPGKAITLAFGLAVLVLRSAPAEAADPRGDIYSTNDFGGIGLMTMRTARMAPDGQYEIGASFVEPYRRYYMTWQILPRVEITFRYTDVTNVINGGPVLRQGQGEFFKDILGFHGGDSTYLDRAFDLKFQVWDEGPIMPAFAVGLQDAVGTGLFSAEYAVFTKRIADFDLTAGMGWGYLATRNSVYNPLRLLSDRFDTRSNDFGRGGKLGLDHFFAGRKAGLFFGVEYFTPIKSLTLKMEYGSVDLDREPLRNPQAESLPVNFALNWRPYDWFNMQVGLERGNSAMVKMSLRQNFQLPGLPHIMDPRPEPVKPRPDNVHGASPALPVSTADDKSGQTWLDFVKNGDADRERARSAETVTFADLMDRRAASMRKTAVKSQEPQGGKGDGLRHVSAQTVPVPEQPHQAEQATQASGDISEQDREVARRISQRLGAAGFPVESIKLDEHSLTVYYMKTRFREYSKNLGRISRILANEAPPEVELFTIVYVGKGLESSRVSVLRKDIENAANHRGSPEEIWANAVIHDPHLSQDPGPDAIKNDIYPDFTWSIKPDLQQYIGDPDLGLYAADLRIAATARLKLRRNIWLSGQVSKFVLGNLDNIDRGSNSVLPHVRSDIRQYLQEGRDSLDKLQLDYLFRPARDLWGRVSVGYFETMYGGVSGELAYEVPDSPWHFGIDLNWVKKRDFDQDFGFQDYDVVTGHVRIAYDLPFYKLTAGVRIGRYLAGDRGATFEIARRFESGIRVGGFFTLTNVSSEDFGEGSFDKGFYIVIPLDMFMLRSSTRFMSFGFRPLTRDGGQFVSVSPSVGGVASGDNYRGIMESWPHFMD